MESLKTMKVLADTIPGGVAKIAYDQNFTVLCANEGYYQLTGHSPEEYEQFHNSAKKVIDPEDLPHLQKEIEKQMDRGEIIRAEYRIVKKDGTRVWVALNANPLSSVSGVLIFQCVMIDITAQKQMQQALEVEKERYRIVAEFSEDILFEYQMETKRLYFFDSHLDQRNPKNMQNSGIDDFRHSLLRQGVVYPGDEATFISICEAVEQGKNQFSRELRLRQKPGVYVWCCVRGKTIDDDQGKHFKVLGKIINIDSQQCEIQRLKAQAQYDGQTGLYNKQTCESLIVKTLEKDGQGKCHALLIMDVDNFKNANDSLGHHFGDQVLSKVAQQLQSALDPEDLLGRIGGDEFIILLKDIAGVAAVGVKAGQLCTLIRQSEVGSRVDYPLSVSIGGAIYPGEGKTYGELFEKADRALYAAKAQGKNCFMLHQELPSSIMAVEEIPSRVKENRWTLPGNCQYEQELAIYAFEVMAQCRNVEDTIFHLLNKVGLQFELDGIRILEIYANAGSIATTHHWRGRDLSKSVALPPLQQPRLSLRDWLILIRPLLQTETMACYDSHNLKIPEATHVYYQQQQIGSQLLYLFLENGGLKGALAFDLRSQDHRWSSYEIGAFSALAKIINVIFLNMRTYEQMKEDRLMCQAMTENQGLLNFVLNSDSYELLHIGSNTQKKFPQARLGELCYQAFWFGNKPCQPCPLASGGGTVEVYHGGLRSWLSCTAFSVKLENQRQVRLVSATDVTQCKRQIVAHDGLTGLATLAFFEMEVKALLAKRQSQISDKSQGQGYGLLYMDFDKFKYINDAHGYETGNQVLISFADLLRTLLQTDELGCRYGADVFVLLLHYAGFKQLKERLGDLRQQIQQWQEKNFGHLMISVVGGVYCIQPEDQVLSTMLDRANIARKSIKGGANEAYAIYNRALHKKVTQEKEVELLMGQALNNNEFKIYLQPKVDLKTEKIIGAEALVRWQRSNHKIMPPSDFIPLFEKNGFIKKMDFYVNEQVFKLVNHWISQGNPVVPISINVSRLHIKDKKFIPQLRSLLDKYQVSPKLIELELTESIFMDDMDQLVKTVQELKTMGFSFSMDDFGSGYSSLNLLRHLPIDVLKLDKDFFDQSHSSKREWAVLSSIIGMAKNLDMTVLSEGVETRQQAEFLRQAGCDLAQGYLYAKPMPVCQFEEKLKKAYQICEST